MTNPFDPRHRSLLGGLFGSPLPAQPSAVSDLFSLLQPSPVRTGLSAAATDLGLGGLSSILTGQTRRRSDWNALFENWERRESNAETQRIERARDMVRDALSANGTLNNEGVQIVAQGSFTNRTNTRLEADIDLRVQHPDIRIHYGTGVNAASAYQRGAYFNTGRTYPLINGIVRQAIVSALVDVFGALSVDGTGRKAIRVKGLAGSRSEVDVVPVFTLHHHEGGTLLGSVMYPGVAILGRDGFTWTFNYPEQHAENGKRKRLNTGLQFKRIVRIVKRLRSHLRERGVAAADVPSFLIECLIYVVEDQYFTNVFDDRYDRVRRVLGRLAQLLAAGLVPYGLMEINGIKPLFSSGQPWSLARAQAFVGAALVELGDL